MVAMIRQPARRLALAVYQLIPNRILAYPMTLTVYATGVVVGVVGIWAPTDGFTQTVLWGAPRHRWWAGMILAGALVALWGFLASQWRLEGAGLVLFGTGMFVYGLLLWSFSSHDPAVVGLPPMGIGMGAAARIIGLFVLGTVTELRRSETDGYP